MLHPIFSPNSCSQLLRIRPTIRLRLSLPCSFCIPQQVTSSPFQKLPLTRIGSSAQPLMINSLAIGTALSAFFTIALMFLLHEKHSINGVVCFTIGALFKILYAASDQVWASIVTICLMSIAMASIMSMLL